MLFHEAHKGYFQSCCLDLHGTFSALGGILWQQMFPPLLFFCSFSDSSCGSQRLFLILIVATYFPKGGALQEAGLKVLITGSYLGQSSWGLCVAHQGIAAYAQAITYT